MERNQKNENYLNPDPALVEKYRKKFETMDKRQKKEMMAALGWVFLTDNIQKTTREKIQQSMKTNDRVTLLLAFIGIITNIISSVNYINFSQSISKI
jgi:TRAP-type uncharacterized transport system fused permease subunit